MSYERVLIAVALLLVAYGAFIARGAHEAFPSRMSGQGAMPFLSDKPVGEDGFYMLAAAWNWGTGRGLTIGGQQTTGVQPLATLVYAGAARLVAALGGSRWDLIRVVILLGTLNVVALALLLGALARAALPAEAPPETRRALFFAAALLTLTSFGAFRMATYGLETGLYLVLLAAFARTAIRTIEAPSARLVAALGGIAGLCGLARIDFGVLLAVFLGVLVLRRRLALRHALTVGSVALLVVAPWFAYVHAATGRWMPSSGPAQSGVITVAEAPRRLVALGIALVDHATPWAFTGVSDLRVSALALASLVALGIVLRRVRRGAEARTARSASVEVSGAFAAGVAVLAVVYVSAFYAWHFYTRYTAPLAVVTIPALAFWIVRSVPPDLLKRASLPAAVGLVALFGVWAALSLHRGTVANTHAVTAGFVARQYPDATVGALQSGTVGYFHARTVNLDGKVNARALAASQAGTLGAYVRASPIDVLLEWTGFEAAFDSAAFAATWQPCPLRPNNGATVCYERRGAHASRPE